MAAVVGMLLVVAFVRSWGAAQASLYLKRGRQRERAGDFRAAVTAYEAATKHFPSSTKVTLRLASAAYKAGDRARAAELMKNLEHRALNNEDTEEAIALQTQLKAHPRP